MAPTRQQRFARNVDGNIYAGLAGDAFRCQGYKFPTHQQMDKFDKYHLPHDIDQEIRDAVIDLNDAGYRTGGSCQGHSRAGKGFITINPHESEIPIQFTNRVLKAHPNMKSRRAVIAAIVETPSQRVVNASEVKGILKENDITRVSHSKANFDPHEYLICKQQYHAFEFPALTPGRRQ